MSFGIGLVCYTLGAIAIALCIFAIPGRAGDAVALGHGSDHGHGHGH